MAILILLLEVANRAELAHWSVGIGQSNRYSDSPRLKLAINTLINFSNGFDNAKSTMNMAQVFIKLEEWQAVFGVIDSIHCFRGWLFASVRFVRGRVKYLYIESGGTTRLPICKNQPVSLQYQRAGIDVHSSILLLRMSFLTT